MINGYPAQIDKLRAFGKELNDSPLQSSDRACTVKMADGSMRVGITQVVIHTHSRTPMQGALFFRVSFRFVGEESDPLTTFHTKQDTVWAVVDRRDGLILFGPDEGMFVRARGLGIGTYLLGHLIRLLGNAELGNGYGVVDIALPVKAAEDIDPLDRDSNQERAEIMLTRAGFYVSKAAGKKVAGARRFSDLKNIWSSERVRFLTITQLMEFAGKQLAEAQANKRALDLAAIELEAAHQQVDSQRLTSDQAIQDLTTELNDLQTRPREALSDAGQDQFEISPRGAPDAVPETPSRPLLPANGVAKSEGQLITIDFGKSLTRLAWGALGLGALFLVCILTSAV